MKTTVELSSPNDFHLRHTIRSHGWYCLPPFHLNEASGELSRLLSLETGKLALVTISDAPLSLVLHIEHRQRLGARDIAEVKRQISDCLRLTEDYSSFYAVVTQHKQFVWAAEIRAGRLLRGPTVFEDVVKMLCTTNCNWGATEKMVKSLVRSFGENFRDDFYTFPKPERIAESSEKFLRDEIRLGYRAPYLLELAEAVATGKVDLESWKNSELPTVELYKKLRGIKGIGDYAAGNILKLLGRYDYLAIDSWCRAKFSQLHRRGQPVEDKAIAAYYKKHKEWQGLFMWLDLTKDWYDSK